MIYEGLRYNRVVLKVSGESLGPVDALDQRRIIQAIQTISEIHAMGVLLTVVVGGGNVFRGANGPAWSLDRAQADEIGMYATGLNALMLNHLLHNNRVPTRLFSRGPCVGIGTPYTLGEPLAAVCEGEVALLSGGMGVSGVSTDVCAVEAAINAGSEAVIMAKHAVNGVYTADPKLDPYAEFIPEISASEALERGLRVMDIKALTLAVNHGKTIHVIPAAEPNGPRYVLEGKEFGSVILPR